MTAMTQPPTPNLFIVSGGARGITAQCVIQLAKALPSKWILLGRSLLMDTEPDWAQGCHAEAELKQRIMQSILSQGQKPTPMEVNRTYRRLAASREIAETLQTLKDLGCEAVYLSVDVTDGDALQQQLATVVSQFGPVTGVIHGAGNLADKRIERKTAADYEQVYGPKIRGLQNLIRCIPITQLKYLVLFSSVAGFYGNAGQTDYALANEILNKFSLRVKQQYPDCHVVAINWGPWDSGMVTPALKKAFEQRGIEILPVADGTRMLVNELSSRHHNTAQVIVGSPIEPPLALIDGELKTHRLRRKLRLATNPFLQDHVISGHQVLPFTCSFSWIGNAGEQLYPGYKSFICENVKVLKGIVFNQSLADEYILDLKELSKNEEEIVLEGKIWALGPAGKMWYHFSSQLTLRRQIPAAPILDDFDLTPDHQLTTTGSDFYRKTSSSLFHGPTFQGLERIISLSPQRVTAEYLARPLEPLAQGQFPPSTLDPYISDIQTHSVWVWLNHFHQAVCLPAKIQRFENFETAPYNQPFYTTTDLVSKTVTSLVIDIIVHDQNGRIYSRVKGAEATIFPLTIPVVA